MPDTIDVMCFIAPDGNVEFMKREEAISGGTRAIFKKWQDSLTEVQREEYRAAHVVGGFLLLTMLEADFEKL